MRSSPMKVHVTTAAAAAAAATGTDLAGVDVLDIRQRQPHSGGDEPMDLPTLQRQRRRQQQQQQEHHQEQARLLLPPTPPFPPPTRPQTPTTSDFVCDYHDCGRRFHRKTSLTNHRKAHNNIKSRSINKGKRIKQQRAAEHAETKTTAGLYPSSTYTPGKHTPPETDRTCNSSPTFDSSVSPASCCPRRNLEDQLFGLTTPTTTTTTTTTTTHPTTTTITTTRPRMSNIPPPSSLLSAENLSNFVPFTNIDHVMFVGGDDDEQQLEAIEHRSLSPISESVAISETPEPIALDIVFGQAWSHEENGLKTDYNDLIVSATAASHQHPVQCTATDAGELVPQSVAPNTPIPLGDVIGQLPSSSAFIGLSTRPTEDHSELRLTTATEPMDDMWYPDFNLAMFNSFSAFTGI